MTYAPGAAGSDGPTQPTQGEWKTYNTVNSPENHFKVGVFHSGPGAYQQIADCSYETTHGASGQEALANASLIAAAPKLLEALKKIRGYASYKLMTQADFDFCEAALAAAGQP